jgi:hypothetical protein
MQTGWLKAAMGEAGRQCDVRLKDVGGGADLVSRRGINCRAVSLRRNGSNLFSGTVANICCGQLREGTNPVC